MNKFFSISSWVLFVVAVFITLGFIGEAQRSQNCKSYHILINHDDDNYFIDENDVLNMLPFDLNIQDSVATSDIQVDIIEKKLNNHPAIYNAEVYLELDGTLNISVQQRKPIVRIFNQYNESYYLDNFGNLMPLSDQFTARVPIISGHISARYDKWYLYSMDEVMKNDTLKGKTILDDLYKLTSFIYEDPFWYSQIEQMYVNKDLEVELIPRVGNHTIVFGEIADIPEKFNKLIVFYQKGLSKTGWNEYSSINLKFKNQVVCTKRY